MFILIWLCIQPCDFSLLQHSRCYGLSSLLDLFCWFWFSLLAFSLLNFFRVIFLTICFSYLILFSGIFFIFLLRLDLHSESSFSPFFVDFLCTLLFLNVILFRNVPCLLFSNIEILIISSSMRAYTIFFLLRSNVFQLFDELEFAIIQMAFIVWFLQSLVGIIQFRNWPRKIFLSFLSANFSYIPIVILDFFTFRKILVSGLWTSYILANILNMLK